MSKVVGHGTGEKGAPALQVQVLDPWTDRHRAGEVVSIAVRQ